MTRSAYLIPCILAFALAQRPGYGAEPGAIAAVQTVRNEWEHNLSQQVYISSQAWDMARMAKEETIKMINLAATRIGDNANAGELSAALLEVSIQAQVQKNQQAIDVLKNDLRQLF